MQERLTPRERQVMDLIAEGRTNAEIAQRLGISFSTVKTHVSDILGRLGVDRREDAVAEWHAHRVERRRGWLLAPLLAIGLTGVAAVVAVAMYAAGWGSNSSDDDAGDILRVPLAELEVGVPKVVGYRPDPWRERPLDVIAVLQADGTVLAFASIDPHSGCAVEWWPDQPMDNYRQGSPDLGAFKALCTGSAFVPTGERVFGPAPRGLDRYLAGVRNGVLEIDFRRVILGACNVGGEGVPTNCSRAGAPEIVDKLPKPPASFLGRGDCMYVRAREEDPCPTP